MVPIYGTTLADTLGYTMMIPLLPSIIKIYHATPLMAAMLLSLPALFSAIAAPIWGKASDRIGRKTIILIAQGLSLIGYLMLALSHSFALIVFSRIISGCGGGSLGTVQSYIADSTDETQREAAYSVYGAIYGLAFIVGPAIAGSLMSKGIAWPFFLAALLEVLNIAFTARFLPLKKRERTRTDLAQSWRALMEKGVRRVIVRHFLFIFAVVAFLANFSIFVNDALHTSVRDSAYLLAGAGAVGGLSILAVAPLSKRIGDTRLAQAGLLLNVGAYVLMIFVGKGWPFAGALVLWAIGSALVEPTLTALLSDRAQQNERGAIMGMNDSVNSLAMILGPAVGGAIVGTDARLLGVISGASAAAAFWFGQVKEKSTMAKESRDRRSHA